MLQRNLVISIIIISFNFFLKINTQNLPLCDSLNHLEGNENDVQYSERKFRRIRALCNAIYSSRVESDENEMDSIPDFDLSQMHSDQDVNQILKRFRRSRSSSGGGRFSSGGGRFSSGGGRFSSGGSRFSSSSRSGSSSSSGGSRIFGGSRSSAGASSSGGSSRIFSRSSSSSSSGSGSRIFSRGGSGSSGGGIFSRSSGASAAGSGSGSGSSSGTRMFSRSGSSSAPSSSGIRIFSRTPTSSNTGNRVREAIRTMIRKPASPGKGISPGTGGSGVIPANKPSLSDKIRKITQGGGGAGGINTNTFGSGTGGFGGGGSGSGGNAWVRAGKKFLPVAANFGKRYYQRRKYNKGMYAGAGAGAGYYAGSRMSHHGQYYPNNHYDYPPVEDTPPDQIDGKAPTVFYCIQEDLNMTLVNQTLNDDGIGICNISGQLVSCPIEIECKTNEADNCCEDEQRTPYCCGGSIPEEYASQYGGYADDMEDAGESIHRILNVVTVICALLASTCFTMWHRQGQ